MFKKTILAVSVSLVLSACGGGGGGSSATAPVVPESPAPVPVIPTPTPDSPTTPTAPPIGDSTVIQKTYSIQVNDMKAQVWKDNGFNGSGVDIAVLDGGINNAGAFGNVKISANQEYYYNQNTGFIEKDPTKTATYMNDHGQQMAEVAMGSLKGVAEGASLISGMISLDPGGSTSGMNMLFGTNWAMGQGAEIVNISFQYGGMYAPKDDLNVSGDTRQMQQVFRDIVANNTLVVNSAGNMGESVSGLAYNIGIYNDIASSIAKENVLIAGALNQDGSMANYSNFAGGSTDIQARFLLAPGYGELANGNLVFGTSPAAANISGAAALMKQRWNHLGGKEISKIMIDTADRGFSGYSAYLHGQGKLNMQSAFSPIGQTSIAIDSIGNKQSISQAVISLPNVDLSKSKATASIFDSYNRDFDVSVSSFVRPEVDNRFSQQVDYLNGFEYVYRQDNKIVSSAINGKNESLVSLDKNGTNNFVLGLSGKHSETSLPVANLADKNLFDSVSQQNHMSAGYKYKGDNSTFLIQNIVMGNEVTGFTTGFKSGYSYGMGSGKMFVNNGFASGKMTNTLNGQTFETEIGYVLNDFVIKAYNSKTTYEDTLIVKDFNAEKNGLMLSKLMSVGLFSNDNSEQLSLSFKVEQNNGEFGLLSANGFNQDTGSINLKTNKVSYDGVNQYVGLTYVAKGFKVFGLYDVNSVTPNSGLVINYSKNF